jgi:hypothetical protein
MTEEEARRLALVRDLVAMTMPLGVVVRQLAAMNWDYEGDGVELAKEHLVNALHRYLRGDVSEADIEVWANQVEGRDVHSEPNSEQEIEDVLYELANPLLTQPLDRGRAEHLVSNLSLPT